MEARDQHAQLAIVIGNFQPIAQPFHQLHTALFVINVTRQLLLRRRSFAQIVRERRATFEASPEQNALRPGAATNWKNLFLAGDWTDTGLPATIEGSVRSGDRAADLVLAAR